MQLEALKSLALSVAAARSPESVLREMVQGLGMWEGVALARVWLLHHPEHGAPYLAPTSPGLRSRRALGKPSRHQKRQIRACARRDRQFSRDCRPNPGAGWTRLRPSTGFERRALA